MGAIGKQRTREAAMRIAAEERSIKAYEYRRGGMSYREIGKKLGVSHTQAEDDVRTVLAEAVLVRQQHAESVAQDIALEEARLDMLLMSLMKGVQSGDSHSSATFLKVCESRRKLLGYNAPDKVNLADSEGKTIKFTINLGDSHDTDSD